MVDVPKEYGVASLHTVFPTGVNIIKATENAGAAFRKKHCFSSTQPILVHIGRAVFEKNIEFLLVVTASLVKQLPELALKQLTSLAIRLDIQENVKKDILVNGIGALIAKEEANDFSDKILNILRDPELKEILSKEGFNYAQAWQPSEMVKRMIKLSFAS
jgi:glycosyltransferase involved in cell wall biosynthesis